MSCCVLSGTLDMYGTVAPNFVQSNWRFSCLGYKNRRRVRVGYYVHGEGEEEEDERRCFGWDQSPEESGGLMETDEGGVSPSSLRATNPQTIPPPSPLLIPPLDTTNIWRDKRRRRKEREKDNSIRPPPAAAHYY